MNSFKVKIFFICFFSFSNSIFSQADMLDELERKTLNDEKSSIYLTSPIDQNESNLKKESLGKKQKYKTHEKSENLNEINTEINKLAKEIEQLGIEFEHTKKLIYKRSIDDHYLNIILFLQSSELTGAQSIVLKLDGFVIFDQNSRFANWLESIKIPVFFGPVTEGEHYLDIEVSFFKKQSALDDLKELFLIKEQKRFDFKLAKEDKKSEFELIINSKLASSEFKKAGL